MTDELRDLGRRAIACRGWTWLDGMMSTQFGSRYNARLGGLLSCEETDLGDVTAIDADLEPVEPDCLPDFSDPATLGCLLRLVREAWNDEWLTSLGFYNSSGAQWFVHGGKPHGRHFLVRVTGTAYPSEAEALIAALEAAP